MCVSVFFFTVINKAKRVELISLSEWDLEEEEAQLSVLLLFV